MVKIEFIMSKIISSSSAKGDTNNKKRLIIVKYEFVPAPHTILHRAKRFPRA